MAPIPEQDTRSDIELIEAVKKNGSDRRVSFEVLMWRYQSYVLRILFALLGDQRDAEDVAQDAFVRIYVAIDRWPPADKFRPWLRRVVVNSAFNHRRSVKTRTHYIDKYRESAVETGTAVDSFGERDKIQQVLDSLSYPFREILVLRYVEELNVAEIAELLNLGASAAKMRLKRARDEFRQVYDNERLTLTSGHHSSTVSPSTPFSNEG